MAAAGLAVFCLPAGAQAVNPTTPDQTAQRTLGLPNQTPTDNGKPVQLRTLPANGEQDTAARPTAIRPVAVKERPGEFERFVQSMLPTDEPPIRRFGSELVTDASTTDPMMTQESAVSVPDDYLIRPGDEIALAIWGSADAELKATVDRAGRVVFPRIGAVQVAGTRYADLHATLDRKVAKVFRNYQLSVSMGKLRGIRVFMTGFARQPGSVTVNALSSVVHVLMRTGGPTAAGSFRDVQLHRRGQVIGRFDLYDLLLKGDRSADQLVQTDDVIFIGPVGPQVAVIGSVNQPAIVELKGSEGIQDVLQMAGGLNAVADRSRVAVERLGDRSGQRVRELAMVEVASAPPLAAGDLIRVFSAVTAILPVNKQNKRVRVEGEVALPGEFVLPAGSRVADALKAAGGLTQAAYIFGTELSREAVRKTQQENYDRALRDFETELAKSATNQRGSATDDAASQAANARLLDRLRLVRPTGRVVLELTPDSTALPDLSLEDGDRIYIPSRSSSIGVFGSVFNGGSFLLSAGRDLDSYVSQAGGPTRGADLASTFVIRANGSVISTRQNSGWFSSRSDGQFGDVKAEPGDTVFVPEETNKSTFLQSAKDWTQVFYQFGLGVAAMKTLGL
jgi:protein involved in polysaccharide export with SLBB domain